MKNHVSFRTGGDASFYVTPQNSKQLRDVISLLRKNGEKFAVMGNGSNILVSDKGFDGTVVCIGRALSDVSVEGNEITAMAGALLSKIANTALKHSLTGFEFASGIPGSLGGAIIMNAGAYGGEMKDVVLSTEYIAGDLCIKTVTGAAHGFGYRRSGFTADDVVVSAKLMLKGGNADEIRKKMDDFNLRRREKQPLEYPSAGSTFKRPEGFFAGKLIDDAGLRGFKIGGAMVSEKHCGFVINYDNASSGDIFRLMEHIKSEVYNKFSVVLEPEVRFLGEF